MPIKYPTTFTYLPFNHNVKERKNLGHNRHFNPNTIIKKQREGVKPLHHQMTASLSCLERYCLVTVGATVGFPELTEQVLQPVFWRYIHSKGFTSLHIQCGPDLQWAAEQLASLRDEVPNGLNIDIFDVRKNLMKEEMVLCKAADGCRSLGLVISHAGSFSSNANIIL